MTNNKNQNKAKKKMSKPKLLLIVLAFVIVFGGQAFGWLSLADYISNSFVEYASDYYFSDHTRSQDDGVSDSSSSENIIEKENTLFRSFYGDKTESGEAITTDELEKIKIDFYKDQTKSGSTYSPGVYIVGTDIDPGIYYVHGELKSTSNFFVLNKADSSNGYNADVIDTFYGHNLISLHEGQVFVCDNEEGFCLRDDTNVTFSSPYTSGVYEVGKDIPAGKYTLVQGSANDYVGYYVMKDLEYTDDSVTSGQSAYSVGSNVTIELEEGTYIELYNITLKKSTGTSGAFA